MDFLKSLKNSILGLLESGSGSTYTYKEVEESRGKLNSNDVLEIIKPIIAEENLSLSERQTLLNVYPPTLQENEETADRHWLVTVFYERLNGKLLTESERSIYFWIIVKDESGEISEKIYARQENK